MSGDAPETDVPRSVVIHAHFYQPPREDPDFDEVEVEESARPWHDWNERIEKECYRAVVAARVHGSEGRIERIVNTLEWISFNVGPTLFTWLERQAPDTVARIIAADRASVMRLGHGNAIAHPCHHVILPLASRRDKVTEVRWGMADFRRRFGREPEGMWLPETAVDDETLDVLAAEGIRFTILAPHQVEGRPVHGHPARYVTANGREITLVPYDGDLSHGIAFGGLIRRADLWLDEIFRGDESMDGVNEDDADAPTPRLVSAATDGETYGHHHKFGEIVLAHVLEGSRARGARVENFASFIARHPPGQLVSLVSPSSWSCAHGIERWRADCGCRLDGAKNPSQAWRGPLRVGLDSLGAKLHEVFDVEGSRLLEDPWGTRDAYHEVFGGDAELRHAFVVRRLKPSEGDAGLRVTRALELLEMERDALRAFTSCAWFFDDIGGLEPRQVLRYARRAMELSGSRERLEPPLLDALDDAGSNDELVGNGAAVYRRIAPSLPSTVRFATGVQAMVDLGVLGDVQGAMAFGDLSPAMRAAIAGGTIAITDRHTLESASFRATQVYRTTSDLAYDLIPLDAAGEAGPSLRVTLADVPERLRLRIREAMRDAHLARCFTASELQAMASGHQSLRELASVALARVIRSLAGAAGDTDIRDVEAVLELYEQLESPIPFDAQTAFWDVIAVASPDQKLRLHGIARRLGFVGS